MRVDTASLSGFTVEADGAVMVWAINETGHLAWLNSPFAGAAATGT